MDRVILHCDANNFFASVESLFRPELKTIPMAVSNFDDRKHGVILAKNDLAKPFGMMEMVSRIKAVLRRTGMQENKKLLQVGQLILSPSEHTVTSENDRVQLTLKEFELLRLFMENLGRVFTREQLLSNIWGTDFLGETRTVDVHIGTLRTKLGICGDYIQTVRGVGYRMEA